MRKPTRDELDELRINPNPRLVWMLNYAIDEVSAKLYDKPDFQEWFNWATSWKNGQRDPQKCVNIAHECFAHKGWGVDGQAVNPVWHALGQLAWGAKEACYSTKQSGWYVIRYIADAMIAFGIAFPEDAFPLLAPTDVVELQVTRDKTQP